MHGKSLVPVLNGDTDEHRNAMITGYYQGIDRCIRDKTWSYIQRPQDEPDELYNLKEDRAETTDLAAQYPEKVKELEKQWDAQVEQIRSARSCASATVVTSPSPR